MWVSASIIRRCFALKKTSSYHTSHQLQKRSQDYHRQWLHQAGDEDTFPLLCTNGSSRRYHYHHTGHRQPQQPRRTATVVRTMSSLHQSTSTPLDVSLNKSTLINFFVSFFLTLPAILHTSLLSDVTHNYGKDIFKEYLEIKQ